MSVLHPCMLEVGGFFTQSTMLVFSEEVFIYLFIWYAEALIMCTFICCPKW